MSVGVQTGRVGLVGAILLGGLITLFGLIFVVGGANLAALGGSFYYVICGLVLLASGILLLLRRALGAALYLLAWIGTLAWTVYEVGFDWWGWLPRLFGPTILAVLVALCLPALRRYETFRSTTAGPVSGPDRRAV
ncbi:D-sorbitol dehydrogenase subunit SldB [Ameyamaea chiangmaiensis NBRC 103196]|uniref:Glycerol dehydrogenase n=1 Tax=Ameyamaea chiangmaiensis TaxID=442969 RepID=A0A850PHD3_9PROT|nr:glycerol dehydrogenase [Ameyamaea chiangmaiensis]MBS4075545.1 glycerol dehydrogenase [Ameyamaea chiangmaiensis]NVN41262.1 glycerol dehydrogenase [Ameyamaea chiangmaiensis]GBQ69371.1 D-sorbitol dehydrogenase subunit SldB [Ameyamaea chiangmaiensis NBRC 103196]